MDKTDERRAKRKLLWIRILRNLFFYALIPALILGFLARPIREAVIASESLAFWILLAALAAVGLNWLVFAAIRRKPPTQLVYAHGVFCLLVVAVIQNEALAGRSAMTSTLSIIAVYLAMATLLLLSFWLATREARPPHVIAVTIWILLWVMVAAMAYGVIRDFESNLVSIDTWITIGSMAVFILGICARRVRKLVRRIASRRRMTGLTEGRILQIIGESYFNRDDEMATRYLVRVQYAVDDAEYETRTRIFGFIARRYGRDAFIGRRVPVRYDPENPGEAYVKRIDRHVLSEGKLQDS